MGFFGKLFGNLKSEIDEDFYDFMFENLILGDVGVKTSSKLIDDLRETAESKKIKTADECKEILKQSMKDLMIIPDDVYEFENKKTVIFVIGVNGVGKTTTIGKIASIYKNKGKKVLLCAADTFRAAATEQLKEWSVRAGVDMVGGVEGQDPSSVLFDAIASAKAKDVDLLIVDTAGRLHNKKNLMDELEKMNRLINSYYPMKHRENWVVLDASTGQNAFSQAKEFSSVTKLNGVVLTKMDGTAKGGIGLAVSDELSLPIKFIGVGEKIDDLKKFNKDEYIDSLFA